VLSEIAARRRLDAVEPVAEVDLVEVELEDLFLAVHPLDARRQEQLLDLAAVVLVGGQEALSRQLLGNRAAALRFPAVPDVGDGRRCDAHQIEAAVLVEPLVLDGNQRLRDIR
jgi:hypothetical protein